MKFLYKHKFIFVAALMVFVLQTGCAGANADLATQMPSNQISQTAENTVVPMDTNAVNATPTPLTIVPSPTMPSSTQDTQNMNLTQIQAGDYSSLL